MTTSPATHDSTDARTTTRVGFIGLGSQGGPMAARIIEAGFPTTLWARRKESLEPYLESEAEIAATPADLGAKSDLVCICVVDDAGVEAVTLGSDGVLAGMAPGGIIAIHSTVHPDAVRQLGEAAAKVGVRVVDAPVSGGGPAAAEGRLLVMMGGAEEDVATCEPVFRSYGEPVVHLGALGAGEVAKVLNNTVFASQLATASSILRIGTSLGIGADQLSEVISHGTGGSFAIKILASRAGDLSTMANLAGPLLRKDVGILAELVGDAPLGSGAMWDAADSALSDMFAPRDKKH